MDQHQCRGETFWRTFRTIGPYEFSQEKGRYGPMIGPYEFSQEKVWTNDWSILRKNPRAHKNKIGTPPPPPQKPPPKKEEFYGHGFFQQKERIFFKASIKLAQPFSGPRIGGHEFYGHKDFSDIRISPGKGMDQWRSKFSESFGLDRHWSIECSSLTAPTERKGRCR